MQRTTIDSNLVFYPQRVVEKTEQQQYLTDGMYKGLRQGNTIQLENGFLLTISDSPFVPQIVAHVLVQVKNGKWNMVHTFDPYEITTTGPATIPTTQPSSFF